MAAGGTTKRRKKITPREKQFAELMVDSGLGCIEAARKVFKWTCKPGSSEARKAVELQRAPRIKEYMVSLEEKIVRETEASSMVEDFNILEIDNLRSFFHERLSAIRDDENAPSQTRYNAISALKKISDPSADHALIMKYLDLIWRGLSAHCPSCHNTFPLWKIENKKLNLWRKETEAEKSSEVEGLFPRRMEILKRADRRKSPHKDQAAIIAAPERHVAGLGAARGGKSYILAMMSLLGFLTPGVEIWILARVYDDAKTEIEELTAFLNTLFFPHLDHMVDIRYDSKSGEMLMQSKWGSLLRVRSAKAKGSITGRELEMALIAEPGWVPAELYEEIRARMSSRLGRIILLGTPKGYTGILARMINMMGKDPKTGRMKRLTPEERTIENGMPWISSMLVLQMVAENNPAYVKADKEAARAELTQAEFESEFEGKMVTEEGAKFPLLRLDHLRPVPIETYDDCVFVLGIDQGPRNFGGCLMAYNGTDIFVLKEYFASDTYTMLYHMKQLQRLVPEWLDELKVQRHQWKLTIFDADPPITGELDELKRDPTESPWPTSTTWRPKNYTAKGIFENWRDETYEYMNEVCARNKIYFDDSPYNDVFMLHDQLMRAQNRPIDRSKDSTPGKTKGWIITDAFRGDHVCDAFILALWTIYSGQLPYDEKPKDPFSNPYDDAQAQFNYKRQMQERRELNGYMPNKETSNDIFERNFGRPRATTANFLGGMRGYYENES